METTISASRRTGVFSSTNSMLLMSGIAASLLYTAMLLFIPMFWDEYNSKTQTVSELSAIDAPTRTIWFPIGIVYTILMIVFGYGVLKSSQNNRALRIAAITILAYAILGVYWPPMHLRGEPTTLTDTLHIVWTAATVLLMVIAIGSGAAAYDKGFRYYSIITLVLLITFGLLTSREAPAIPKNLPTPWIGVWERINIGVFLLWIVAFALSTIRNVYPVTRKDGEHR